MRKFKVYDIAIQAITLLSTLAWAIISDQWLIVMMGYFIIGGWQLVSMVVHTVDGRYLRGGAWRIVHHVITGVALGTGVLLIFGIDLFHVGGSEALLLLIVFAPMIMALSYTALCITELRRSQGDVPN